jgi:CO dehydrogenase maturation factor
MKIAFVGKGGSGKSTMTSLFIRYLQWQSEKSVLAIDADLNMNLAGLLGVSIADGAFLANPDVAETVRNHLKGSNPRLQDTSKFLPTTPPGRGSNLISTANDAALSPFAIQVSSEPLINLLTVGSYDRDGIGQTCYHSHLFVAENLLSHTVTNRDFAVVCDMVAGTDAFAYSLHLQFDAIVLIAEPTPESIEVCALYLDLARESGVDSLVYVVGNKINDEEDLEFIRHRLGRDPLACVPLITALKRARQQGQAIGKALLTPSLIETMRTIEKKAQTPALPRAERMQMLHNLHRKLNTKKWVQLGYGDVADQIDPDFHLHSEGGTHKHAHEKVGVFS